MAMKPEHLKLFKGPNRASPREWKLRTTLDSNVLWLLRYIREGKEDKAQKKAIECLRLGRDLLALQNAGTQRPTMRQK
jgi:hypothetical protein